MLIVRSACSCASACGGNKARETLRSGRMRSGEGRWFLPDSEVMSPNASELDSASLRKWWTANLPEMVKPVIDGEATNVSIRRATRGGWRERMTKEHTWYPGDPLRGLDSAVGTGQRNQGSHNLINLRRWKSDRLMVATKWGNACRAKRPDRCCVSIAKGGAA